MCGNFFSGTGVPPGFGPIKSSFPGNKSGRDARSTARGYVLLLTLFLLVIAAVAMVGVRLTVTPQNPADPPVREVLLVR